MICLIVDVNKAEATLTHSETLTAGMQNAFVKFNFSDDWHDLGKTATFQLGNTSTTVLLQGTVSSVCAIPAEGLKTANKYLSVGVYGAGETSAIPTVWCTLGMVKPSVGPTSDPEVTQSLVDQVQARLQDAENRLITDATASTETGIIGSPHASVELVDNPDTSVGGKIAEFTFDGLQGLKGDTGVTPVFSIENVEKGDEAQVYINASIPEEPKLSFVLPKGDKGDTGDAATIEVGTVTTGEPGTEVVVNNVGDEHAAKFDFTIPKGETGRKGDTGDCCYPEFSVDPSTGRLSVSGADQSSLSYTVNSNGHLEVELL